jgi:hypothetical protein
VKSPAFSFLRWGIRLKQVRKILRFDASRCRHAGHDPASSQPKSLG